MKIHFPEITIPKGFNNAESYLRHLVYEGAKERYIIDNDIFERIEHELDCLKGLEPYFIMFYDLVKYCQEERIIIGPGYGSAASCIINYCLGITSVDPIRWKMKFENFYLKGISGFPDININVDKTRMDDIFKYLQNAYGKDCVLNASINHRFNFKKKHSEKVSVYAVHSSGICIFDKPCDNIVKTIELDDNATGLRKKVPLMAKDELETMGYINIDIMGMEKLSYISNTLNMIERNKGEYVNYNSIPLNDKATFAFIASGHQDVSGIWGGGRELADALFEMKPSNWQDLCNLNALFTWELYKYKDYYIEMMKKRDAESEYGFTYADYCRSTRGVILYHEQITEAIQMVTNMDIAQCEMIRRYMKYPDYLPIKEIFMKGVKEYGVYDSEFANKMWCLLMSIKKHTRSYSHDLSYAIMWYRATWLRVHYPEEFQKCYPLE